MSKAPLQPDAHCLARLKEVVGYLNFSSGTHDPKFLANLNDVYRFVYEHTDADTTAVDIVLQLISSTVEQLHQEGGAFAEIGQTQRVMQLVGEYFLPEYRQFHRDLLRHRNDNELWRPLLLGRVFEVVLPRVLEDDLSEHVVAAARDQLDDYIGYRPVPALESQKIEPYRHEWVRPIPLYVEGAGVEAGPYEAVITKTLEILRDTPPDLLSDSWFQLEMVEELALDPRAYDFDHPVNKRPNYHFGQWDPNRIDNKGFYRRFVLQPLALDSLMARVTSDHPKGISEEDLLFEAAAVLAGTILMASGTSGNSPNCHGSEITLGTLLPHIADYRDRFYEQLLTREQGPRGQRLRTEAERTRQPFGGARQHLNQELARRRAIQLQRVHLAQVYARMGYTEAAMKQAQSVRVASARMLCQIYCRLTAGHHAIDRHRIDEVATYLDEITDLLTRGIECGALVDPWSILGFGANFSLFPSLEDSVRDFRVDDLIQIVEQTLDLCSRAWAEAAAVDERKLEDRFSKQLTQLADWWDSFGSTEVSGVKSLDAKEIEISTNLVAGALNAWHKAGAAAGDVKFWGLFVEQFDTSKAFQLVIEALLDKDDLVASMALMMQWLSQVEYTPLEEGDAALHPLALRWMRMVEARSQETSAQGDDQWSLVARFFGQLEASAEEYWHVPQFELGKPSYRYDGPDDSIFDDENYDPDDEEDYNELSPYDEEMDDEEEGLDNLFRAAYEDVTYRDSTDDGFDSAIYDPGSEETDYELEDEAERLRERLALLTTIARLWKHTAIGWDASESPERRDQYDAWQRDALLKYGQLVQLLEEVHQHRVPPPSGSHESMVEYDRRRMILETLIEQIITTCVEMSDAGRLLRAAAGVAQVTEGAPASAITRTIEILRSVLEGDADGVRQHWDDFARSLVDQELLYVPLGKGGSPGRIVKARALHGLIHDLLGWLPRLGLVRETCELLDVAQRMEIEHPVGPGAITEYDTLFEQGYQALVECVVASAETWDNSGGTDVPGFRRSDQMLVEALQDLTEAQLGRWLRHSRTVRLSVVEKLSNEKDWKRFVDFVERYGRDLFTQRFLSLGNLRSILHQGVGVWLSNQEMDPGDDPLPLIEELGGRIEREDAVEMLTIAIDSVVENFREYRDYNATTTQSDHGELFYMFVDFLRLRASYDRSAWNMKPVFLAHEILIRQGREAAADMWRRAIAARTSERADHYLKAFSQMSELYGMRLPTIAERLGERFIRSLTVDRLRALAAPAIEAIDAEREDGSFEALESEITSLIAEPCGAGLDVPDWVAALEDEVTTIRRTRRHHPPEDSLLARIDQVSLKWEDLRKQLGE
ncbi:hypothetical protein [Aeoliella sp.]|uniref:hypothetical protein n=1 Tax=Aeoliella sp. TaxID=2795800 RepID=UPI003CCC19D2